MDTDAVSVLIHVTIIKNETTIKRQTTAASNDSPSLDSFANEWQPINHEELNFEILESNFERGERIKRAEILSLRGAVFRTRKLRSVSFPSRTIRRKLICIFINAVLYVLFLSMEYSTADVYVNYTVSCTVQAGSSSTRRVLALQYFSIIGAIRCNWLVSRSFGTDSKVENASFYPESSSTSNSLKCV